MILSFYCDDTNPYGRPKDTYKKFVDYVRSSGIAGESSVILAYGYPDYGLLTRNLDAAKEAFIEQVHISNAAGLDNNFELMTHKGIYDFSNNTVLDHPHEGIWLEDPSKTKNDYLEYFRGIIDEAASEDIRFNGMTTPGCVCETCASKRKEYEKAGFYQKINPGVWQALLELAQQGKFAGKTVPCFAGHGQDARTPVLTAGSGGYGVFDLITNAADYFGSWRLTMDYVNADYYITADGKAGRVVELLENGAPYCMFYCHWQGFNPHDGIGWEAFTAVMDRIEKHLGGRVEWKRPSEITEAAMVSGTYLQP